MRGERESMMSALEEKRRIHWKIPVTAGSSNDQCAVSAYPLYLSLSLLFFSFFPSDQRRRCWSSSSQQLGSCLLAGFFRFSHHMNAAFYAKEGKKKKLAACRLGASLALVRLLLPVGLTSWNLQRREGSKKIRMLEQKEGERERERERERQKVALGKLCVSLGWEEKWSESSGKMNKVSLSQWIVQILLHVKKKEKWATIEFTTNPIRVQLLPFRLYTRLQTACQWWQRMQLTYP